jgi:hypothetical protein
MTFDCIVIARSVSDAAIQDTTQDLDKDTLAIQTLDCRATLAMTTVDHANVFMLCESPQRRVSDSTDNSPITSINFTKVIGLET